jgi:hypothetical protein
VDHAKRRIAMYFHGLHAYRDQRSRVALRGEPSTWRAGPPELLLRPDMDWEGAGLPAAPSWRGAINLPVNQLRDRCVFEEGGRVFLLYAIAGESGIAIAALTAA